MFSGSEPGTRPAQIQSQFDRKSFRDFLDMFQLPQDKCCEDQEQSFMQVSEGSAESHLTEG